MYRKNVDHVLTKMLIFYLKIINQALKNLWKKC